jgi:hypothetical protein
MELNDFEKGNYYRAQKRVKEIKSFYLHLIAYALINPIIIVVNLMTSPGYLYFWWCLLGGGVAIFLHGLKAFKNPPFINEQWEERKIKELMEKDKQSNKKWE